MDAVTDYFTADLHLGHENIIKYCDRPFSGVEEMNAAIVANWNAIVAPDDTVHVLGDVVMGRREETLLFIGQLTGHKILYPGNHDHCWYGHGPRALRHEAEYLEAGFEELRQGPIRTTLGGRDVLLCHLPYRGDSRGTDRYREHRPVDQGLWLLHGHIHEKWRQRDRMINVGVDVWDFKPVGEAILASLMEESSAAEGMPPV